ncbi:Com family DNA-binding transcriptional regulator [Pseudomonas sp. SWRI59]|uniref:Com family DNA-binding transcriptional regulator n=1 Tax=unclassified Pseudomonas TaxID=196821 RepID=UPI0016462E97|nr:MULTISPECIES: Com family DNA-binding transcriptional regulator [unclassified Pseudomonas]MBC3503572.1 Com family DNA-binding transcriptional regulator [Pseudomonas sp. SWRI59]MBC3507457.1 Com family DNA-binding transcriptional regulator [Pseudomonas sp. SWRI68]
MQMLRDIRCGKCNRLLARAGGIYQLQIKCARCGVLNQVRFARQDQLPSPSELTVAQK